MHPFKFLKCTFLNSSNAPIYIIRANSVGFWKNLKKFSKISWQNSWNLELGPLFGSSGLFLGRRPSFWVFGPLFGSSALFLGLRPSFWVILGNSRGGVLQGHVGSISCASNRCGAFCRVVRSVCASNIAAVWSSGLFLDLLLTLFWSCCWSCFSAAVNLARNIKHILTGLAKI